MRPTKERPRELISNWRVDPTAIGPAPSRPTPRFRPFFAMSDPFVERAALVTELASITEEHRRVSRRISQLLARIRKKHPRHARQMIDDARAQVPDLRRNP